MKDISKFEESLFDKLNNNSTYEVSSETIKQYITNMRKLAGTKKLNSLKFLNNTQEIINKIDGYSLTTQRKYYSQILTILTKTKKRINHDVLKIYSDKNKDLRSVLKDKSDKKTEKQKENWVSLEELRSITKKLEKELKEQRNYENAFRMMLMGLYTYIEPRRALDYIEMKIYNGEEDSNYNYIDIINNRFIFNTYKTAKTYGRYVYDFRDNKDLRRIIKAYMNVRSNIKTEHDYFLLNPTKLTKLNKSNGITFQLQKITNDYLGKNVSVNMIRSIYLTSNYADKKKELNETTKKMGTSSGMATHTYIKVE